jgi:hypothetical protein
MQRERSGKHVHWSVSSKVIARLLVARRDPQVKYIVEHVTRAKALSRERTEIARLLAAGHVLTNIQHNPHRLATPTAMVRAILNRVRAKEATT